MWTWILITAASLVALAMLVNTIRSHRQRRAQYAEALHIWLSTPPEHRGEALRPLIHQTNVHAPAWYLTGCWYLAASQPNAAARAFGMAHHADCDLMTAALLTFACLKAQAQPETPISHQIAQTWIELKRFAIPASHKEALLLDALERERPADMSFDSPLARFTWIILGERAPTDTPAAGS